ncbi:branched-chain amino acid ABC transporter permease [Epibacterium sp. Ofav1-8]|uniref:branched-chain amino acid ABC transporter permease n=1 Tax=Epibacterium sp. Ofav1-8 TaxID=2917735 RepID=UPI001EF4C9E3|nr:branched-chain amino acid ABC transporter permease [Epibacterium sp. Ofav1-8]MCG7625164.1 branched-chain amino acid ABC transporter permease [Epibacterium sp. Ofav1-8]
MDVFWFLLIDGIAWGAAYGIVALSIVLVHTVTRVVNIAQGEYATLGALGFYMALNVGGQVLTMAVCGAHLALAALTIGGNVLKKRRFLLAAEWNLGTALCLALAWVLVAATGGNYWAAALYAMVLAAAFAVIIFRLTVRPLMNASPLVLVVCSIGVFLTMSGLSLALFGAEPRPIAPVSNGGVMMGPVFVQYQSLLIALSSIGVMAALYVFSERTMTGRALRASAVNRDGAEICGIPVLWAGNLSFVLAAVFSALGGLLLAPMITASYDMGLTLGLKAFVGAAMGGLAEYPAAVIGVLLVGTIESFSAFSASSFRDVIVYTLIIPILIWRNAVKPPEDH